MNTITMDTITMDTVSEDTKSKLKDMFDERLWDIIRNYLLYCTNFYFFQKRDIACDDENNEKIFIHIFDKNKCLLTKITDNKSINRKLVKINPNTNLPIIFHNEIKLNENYITIMESEKDYGLNRAECMRYTYSIEKIRQAFPKDDIDINLFVMGDGLNLFERTSQIGIAPDNSDAFFIYKKGKKTKALFSKSFCKVIDLSRNFKKEKFLDEIDFLKTFISEDIDDDIKHVFKNLEMQQNKDIEEESCLKYSKK